MVGLGRMGGNMTLRLLRGGHAVHVFDRNPAMADPLVREGAIAARSIADLVKGLGRPAVVWVMVPAGRPTEDTIAELGEAMVKGDVVVDGGNSYYRDSMAAGARLAEKGVFFCDAGTSGGVWGLEEGYCLMVGGEDEAFSRVEPALRTLAPDHGLIHIGPVGSGHFVKMVHNGIEYGLLQAYGEGFDLLKSADWPLDLGGIANAWREGSVVRSWLLDLLAAAFTRDPGLETIRGYVDDSGEGRWTAEEAIRRGVPAPVITTSLYMRFLSREDESFSAKVIAALRHEFGGHAVKAD